MMTNSTDQQSNVRRGTIESCSMRHDRSAEGHSDVYQFKLSGVDETLTLSLFPHERIPAEGDSVLVFIHCDYPTHTARMVYDVPDRFQP